LQCGLSTQLKFARENIDQDHQARLKMFQDAIDNPKSNDSLRRAAKERISHEMKRYSKLDVSPENLLKYMKGEHGDTNMASGFAEAYISSPDPIVGGFQSFLKTNLYEVDAIYRKIDNAMSGELEPQYQKAGVNRSRVAELGKQIVFIDHKIGYKDGKPFKDEVVTLLHEFKDYRYDLSTADYNIDQAKLAGDEPKRLKLIADKEKLLNTYFNREYVDAYYKLQDIWKTDLGMKAYDKRMDIIKTINDIEEHLAKDPLPREEELNEIKAKWREYSQLGSPTDLNGDLKTGEDLAISKLIKEYNTSSRNFYEWSEKPGLFETRYSDLVNSMVEDGLSKEASDAKMNQWLGENLKQTLTQDFYTDRKKILNRVAEILSKIPDAQRKELEISPLWESIIDMVKGFRDDDGQPLGEELTNEKIAKIKGVQKQIIDAQKAYTKISGLSEDDQEELNTLFYVRDQNGKFTTDQKERVTELLTKKAKIKEYISAMEFSELTKLFIDLNDLQKKVPTDSYIDVLNNWLSKMDEPPMTKDNVDDILDFHNIHRLRDKSAEFSQWFGRNHLDIEKWNPDDNEMEPAFQRLYIWNRIVPNNPKYYKTYTLCTGQTLAGTPTNEYYYRRVKDEYRTGYDPTTGKVNLKVGEHVDNKGYILPKTRTEHGSCRSISYMTLKRIWLVQWI
jgi:hypothetical protein